MKPKIKSHGGRRKGAGRKPAGTVAWLVSTKPVTRAKIKLLAQSRKLTAGQYLDFLTA